LLQRLSKAQTIVSIKTISAAVAVVAVLGAGWFYRDTETMHTAATTTKTIVKDVLPDNNYTVARTDAEKSGAKADKPKESHALRKCVSDGRTVYTDEKCPTGTRQAPISEGNVTVMPSQRTGGKAKAEDKAK
jgi:hypothetical protein